MNELIIPTDVYNRYKQLQQDYTDKYVQYSLECIDLYNKQISKNLKTVFPSSTHNIKLSLLKDHINSAEKEVADMNLTDSNVHISIDWFNSKFYVVYTESDNDAIERISNALDRLEKQISDEKESEYKKYLELKQKYEK